MFGFLEKDKNLAPIGKRRLLQIWGIIQFSLVVSGLYNGLLDTGAVYPYLIFYFIVLIPVPLIQKFHGGSSATVYLMLSIITGLITVAWVHKGLYDVALWAVVAINVFSAFLRSFRFSAVLFLIAISNVLAMGIAAQNGVLFVRATMLQEYGLIHAIVLLTLAAICWIIISHLSKAYQTLNEEDIKVAEQNQEIQSLIFYDSLTGLANRALVIDRCSQAIDRARRSGTIMGLFFIDLDDFKAINDSLGHKGGDTFLKAVAERLKLNFRSEDTVCRFAGDEFVVLVEKVANREELALMGQKILDLIAFPVTIDQTTYRGSSSVGVAVYPDDGEDFETLSNRADMAMYKSKNLGKNQFSFYNEGAEHDSRVSLGLLSDLRGAVEKGQLEMFYQPQFDFQTGAVSGAEALIRWIHPERGMIRPDEFIPLAETGGMINEIGDWILHQVHDQALEWHHQHMGPLTMAINVSPVQMENPSFSQSVALAFEDLLALHIPLEVEFTESFMMRDVEKFQQTIEALQNMRVRLAIDDFGSGYSNLSYLNRFPLSTLKIDRAFIQNIDHLEKNRTVVQSIINLCHALDIEAVAEGVETAAEAGALKDMGCNYGQGFFWARPMPPKEFAEFYLAHSPKKHAK